MMPIRFLFTAILLCFLSTESAIAKSPQKKLPETLHAYSATIRWEEFSQALAFVDVNYLAQHPLSQLELERYRQVRVSYYHDSDPVFTKPDEAHIVVEIGLINVNTQSARSIVDRQVWRWDRKAKRWWLMTGLPDITQR